LLTSHLTASNTKATFQLRIKDGKPTTKVDAVDSSTHAPVARHATRTDCPIDSTRLDSTRCDSGPDAKGWLHASTVNLSTTVH